MTLKLIKICKFDEELGDHRKVSPVKNIKQIEVMIPDSSVGHSMLKISNMNSCMNFCK